MTRTQLALLAALPAVILMMSIDITAAYLILTPAQASLHLNSNQLPWIASLYLLFFIGSIIIGGKLGDKNGHRNILLMGIGLFALASASIGLASTASMLFLGRAIQGMGAGLIWPNSSALIFQSLDDKQRGLGLGLFAALIGLGLAIGPILAGVFVTHLGWQWVFLVNIPFSILSIAIILMFLKNTPNKKADRIDPLGAIMLTMGLMFGAFAIGQLPSSAPWHAFSIPTVLACIILIALFINQQRRAKS